MAKRNRKISGAPADADIPANPDTAAHRENAQESPITPTPTAVDELARSRSWSERTTSKAEETRQRGPYHDSNKPFSIAHNNAAGVKLLKFDRFKQVQLAFASDVSDEMDGMLTARGWKFRPQEGVYTKQFGADGQAAAIIVAKRTYDEIVDALLADNGVERSNER